LLRSRWHETGVAGLFLLPALLGFLVFFLYPTLRGIYLSFTEYSILVDPTWIVIKNYTAIFSDELFWNAMAVTVPLPQPSSTPPAPPAAKAKSLSPWAPAPRCR